MPRFVVVLTAVLALYFAPALRAQKIDLDLTVANRPIDPPAPDSEVITTSTLIGEGSDGALTSPLRARLVKVSPSCEVGDAIVFDVELHNTGRNTLVIPWTVDPANEGLSNSRYAFPVMRLSLQLVRPDSPELIDGGEILYGNPTDSFTVRALAPQERVVVRGTAVCRTLDHTSEHAQRRGHMPFRVIATVVLQKNSSTLDPTSRSSATQPMTIVYPEK
jgi:hypothetical protein